MGGITVVGVGQRAGELTENAQKALESDARVVLHTDRCPCAVWLRDVPGRVKAVYIRKDGEGGGAAWVSD